MNVNTKNYSLWGLPNFFLKKTKETDTGSNIYKTLNKNISEGVSGLLAVTM